MNSATEEPGRTVLVTGATGLLGSHVAELFAQKGWKVRAIIRPRSDSAFLEQLGCEFVIGDLTEPASLAGCASGCDVVVHSGAQMGGAGAPWERHLNTNVEGTSLMLSESVNADVRRFVHISTVSVYGLPDSALEPPITEDIPLDTPVPENDHYGRSKRMAESLVRESGQRIEWCILRPDMVMGERDRLFTLKLVDWVSRPVLATLGSGNNDLPLIYAGNVALAVWLAATHENAAFRTYNVTDDGELTQKELVRIASGRGDDAPVLPLPLGMVMLGTYMIRALGVVVPPLRRSLFTSSRVRFFAEPDPFSCERIRAELGWQPEVSTEEGWRRSVEWYRQNREMLTSAAPGA